MIIEKDLCFILIPIILCTFACFYTYCNLKIKLNKQKELFIKTLGHDFKVVVLAQIRALNIIQNTMNKDNEHYDIIKEINNSSKHNLEMINMLSDIYKADSGENIFGNEYFSINSVYENLLSGLEEMIECKGLKITIHTYNSIIYADRKYLSKVIKLILYTAINNSIHNSKINLLLNIKNSQLNFKISYKGQAISNEAISGMLSNSSLYTTVGHNIHMEFCKKIIEHQGGHINFFVNNNKIYIFKFSIPLKMRNRNVPVTKLSNLYALK